MADVFEIPTSPTPQSFAITLSGVQYRVTLRWNPIAQLWFIDFADVAGNALLLGVPVVTGADLLAQYAYLNFGGALFAMTDDAPDLPPGFTNLGKTGHLYWIAA
jgi:hypothetical protein